MVNIKKADRTSIRTVSLTVPLSETEKEILKENATKNGLTLATYARMVLLNQASGE